MKAFLSKLFLSFFVLLIGVSIAVAIFVKDKSVFDLNYRNLLTLDQNTQSTVEDKVQQEVQKRVVVLEENAVIDVIKKSSPSVVSIIAEGVALDPFRGFVQQENGIGTGFVVDSNLIFTNRHVVEENLEYRVLLSDGKTSYPVVEINKDPVNDFAILKVDSNGADLPKLPLGSSENLQVGQTVIAIGNALGEFNNTASKGIISGIGRSLVAGDGYGQTDYLDNVIQTDAALNPGNSGGPLLDLSGNVIGINVARAGADNIGFSLPIDALKPVYDGFKATGKIQRPYLGVRYTLNTEELSKINRAPQGAIVQEVLETSPAGKAGLEKFDIITKIDGDAIDSDNTLARIISKKKVGDKIELTVDRGGKELKIEVTLAAAE